jgi:endonuclease/exonuclease/phosphatase family metal-dependent hydrolase
MPATKIISERVIRSTPDAARAQRSQPPPATGGRHQIGPPRERPKIQVRGAAVVSYLFLLFTLLVWLLIRFAGDRWWLATVMLYAPRWIYAAPLPGLALWAMWRAPNALLPLALSAAIIFWPIMGLCVPWMPAAAVSVPPLRVVTCNLHGGQEASPHFARLVREKQPDVVAVQEWSADIEIDWPEGWQVVRQGPLAIASRFPLANARHHLRQEPPSQWPPTNGLRCTVSTPQGELDVCCIHLQTPRSGLESVLDRRTIINPARSWELTTDLTYRQRESRNLANWLSDGKASTIITGDFNMPVESAIYRNAWSRWTNAFSVAGWGYGYSKITQKRWFEYGTRIDHVLFGKDVRCVRCELGPDVGSDHLPVLADLVVTAESP